MKAIITGITGLHNRGVQALVIPIIEQLRQRQQDLKIQVLTDAPDYDRRWLEPYNVQTINNQRVRMVRIRQSRFQKFRLPLSRFYEPLTPPAYQAFKQNIRDASVMIVSGGDIFGSDYGYASIASHLLQLELALDAGIPVVFLAHSIGPFKTEAESEYWVRVAQRSTMITVREKLSYDYVRSLGISEDLVKLTADPAFLLTPSPYASNLLGSLGVTKEQPVVAIAPSQSITKYAGLKAYKQHLEAWQKVIKVILNEFNAQVLIIPHVQYQGDDKDDRIIANNLLRSLNFEPRVHLVGIEGSASEFKGLISQCDLVVAERMHAAIAGLSSGVCTVAVGYSVKAEGIMTDLLGTELVKNGLLIPIQKFLDADAACSTVQKAWNLRQEVAAQLKQVLPEIKNKAQSNFDLIGHILRN
ncbi:MAG: polysaccharide pyruvyl transferase family protein [Crocosphaera sp.]|nr:polysaccharide pyruvyl transferase family protein [Crocosphaera sp.]